MGIGYATVIGNWVQKYETYFSFQDLDIGVTGKSISVRNDSWKSSKSTITAFGMPGDRNLGP